MIRLATTLLHHTTRSEKHYDLLIQMPGNAPHAPVKPLWAARVGLHPRYWSTVQSFLILPLPAHRIRYLTYQGPLSDGRGFVTRVDAGHCIGHLWSPARLDLQFMTRHLRTRWALTKVSERIWRAAAVNIA